MQYNVEVMIPTEEIQRKTAELGRAISDHYRKREKPLLLIGLLRGSFVFMADLCRAIDLSLEVDFMTVSSYGCGMDSSRDVKILKDLDEDVVGKDLLIVEDIIDSGHTLSRVRAMLALRQPESILICTLLDKPERREIEVPVEWVGFTIPDEFVVGYGIDYAQRHRNLPYIGRVKIPDKSSGVVDI